MLSQWKLSHSIKGLKKVGETPSDRILRTVTLLWETPFYISMATISRIWRLAWKTVNEVSETFTLHVEDVNNDWPVSTPRIAATRRPEQAYPYTPALRNFPMPLRRLLDLD